jgi:hypothetical protein
MSMNVQQCHYNIVSDLPGVEYPYFQNQTPHSQLKSHQCHATPRNFQYPCRIESHSNCQMKHHQVPGVLVTDIYRLSTDQSEIDPKRQCVNLCRVENK